MIPLLLSWKEKGRGSTTSRLSAICTKYEQCSFGNEECEDCLPFFSRPTRRRFRAIFDPFDQKVSLNQCRRQSAVEKVPLHTYPPARACLHNSRNFRNDDDGWLISWYSYEYIPGRYLLYQVLYLVRVRL